MQRIVLLSVAVVGLWPVAHAADRSLIGMVVQLTPEVPGAPNMYYIGADERRYVFIEKHDEGYDFDTHATWFANRDNVLEASREELESLLIGGVVTLRRGIKLVGLKDDPRVFVVEDRGVLREISQELLQELFGPTWQEHLVYLPDWLFHTHYVLGLPYVERLHPDGLLFQYPNDPQVYLLDYGSANPIDTTVMFANGFRLENVFTMPPKFTYRLSAPIYRREERLTIPAGPVQMLVRGEVNNQPGVDIADAVMLLTYLFQGAKVPGCLDAADVDDNGHLNLTDPVRLLQYLFLGGHEPEFPGTSRVGDFIDYDPTPDQLICACFRCDIPQLEIRAAPFPEGTVRAGATNVTIGRFTLRVRNGPKVTPQTTRLGITLSRRGTSDAKIDLISNVKIRDLGRFIAGPFVLEQVGETIEDSNGIFTWTSPWVVPDGHLTIEVVADLDGEIPAGDLITVEILPTPSFIATVLPALLGPSSSITSTARMVTN